MKHNLSTGAVVRSLCSLAFVAAMAGVFGPGCDGTSKLTVRVDGSSGVGENDDGGGGSQNTDNGGPGDAGGTIEADSGSDSGSVDSAADGAGAIEVGGCNGTALNGVWIRASDRLTMILTSDGCAIRGTADNSGYLHTIAGTYDDASRVLRGTIKRTTRSSSCTTLMDVTILLTDATHFTMAITGTDGKCDLLKTYSETSVLVKQ
ncbi:MAG TPA: hypothetical protein VF550_05040 [Polyangia bacterium]